MGSARSAEHRRRSYQSGGCRRWGGARALVLVALTVAAGLTAPTAPAGATTTGPTPVGTKTTLSSGAGNQIHPHVSGTLATYTNDQGSTSEIRYQDLATGVDAAIPNGGHRDELSDVSGTMIVFRRIYTSGSTSTRPIMAFDAATGGSPVELDPQPGVRRSSAAIGGRTVAWVQFHPDSNVSAEIVVYDLDTGVATPLTADGLSNVQPSVSPDGLAVTWTKCRAVTLGCDIYAATRAGGTWTTTQLTDGASENVVSDTNGQRVVYASNAGGDWDIRSKALDGSDEHVLRLPGIQSRPNISGNLVSFEHDAPEATRSDLWLYDLAHDVVYQLTDTPATDEVLNDLSVGSDGIVRVVWAQPDGLRIGHFDAFALSFRLEANTAPTITSFTAPLEPVPLDTPVQPSAAFSDADANDSHTCSFDWGDGTANTVVAGATSPCSASHSYTAAGIYTLAVTVTDAAGASDSEVFQYVVVYDPSAGFVTGGGWIDSPAGAYTADPSLAGRARFGFVSRYKPGATRPDGNTHFQFHAAGFDFRSSVYDWLVVSGPKAQYKGSGTINDAGDYAFLLTANDGQQNGGGGVDRLRLKIWDKASGDVVYDNQSGADDDAAASDAIEGGSIVIHKN